MIKLICEKIRRIINAKKILEKELKVKLENRGKELTITGKPEKEYFAGKIIEAINFGFEVNIALMIKEEDLIFEILNIKDYTKRGDLERIRGRLIGRQGGTKKALMQLTECFIEINENKVGIIGYPEKIQLAHTAITSLIKGAKQANVYAYLEHHKIQPIIDLGIKEKQ
jgi:ribosomal RNA assembly protein